MPTVEQLKLQKEKVEHYCAHIAEDKDGGLANLFAGATAAMQGNVLALALARDLITIADIPPKVSGDVAERFLKEAAWRERDEAAVAGTDFHDLAERAAQGEIIEIPTHLQDHFDSWLQFCREFGMQFVDTEFTVFSTQYNYAGTGDFLGYSELHPEWGLILGDYKTSKSGIWPDVALQLAALKYAEFVARCFNCAIDGDECLHPREALAEDREALRDVRTCIGVQITADGYQVVPVRVSRDTFNIFLSAINIARWKTEGESWALDKTAHPFTPRKVTTNG